MNTARVMQIKMDVRQEGDEWLYLLIAMVKRARLDLVLPTSRHGGTHPSAADKRTAATFLQELQRSACQRTVT